MNWLARPLVSSQTYRALAFFVARAGVWARWPSRCSSQGGESPLFGLAITPLVVPLLIGLRAGVGLLAQAEAGLARGLLGVEVTTPGSSARARLLESGLQRAAGYGVFWKQQAAPAAGVPDRARSR